MSQETNEQLVEEIAQGLVEQYYPNLLIARVTKWDREVAESIIARIGKAYADGMPLPGQVGRIEATENDWHNLTHSGAWLETPRPIMLIALRPEEGRCTILSTP